MDQQFNYDRPVRRIAIITLCMFFVYGLLITCFPLFRFWIDEWLLIDNIKFKSAAQLCNGLDHTQQFPRLYLELIKSFSATCDYSYFSLRLPSFLAHCFGLILLYRLSGRIFRQDNLSHFLWVMIYVSFSTSIHYFVQLKQYTMEMALSLVGIWQLLELLGMETKRPSISKQMLICFSFALCPFFSYTYPIVIAPIYLITAIRTWKSRRWNVAVWLPLFIGILAVLLCYQLDTKQVLADKGMQDFWKDLLMKTFNLNIFFTRVYLMFCNLGSGELFANIFGILGLAAFLNSCYVTAKTVFKTGNETDILNQYGCILLCVVFGLFAAGKLPLGTFRLNSFVVPALGFLIVHMLSQWGKLRRLTLAAPVISLIIFPAATGNIYVTMAELAGAEHRKKLRIYETCDHAIKEARERKIPVLVTSAIAYPFDDRWPGDWILKTHPRYKVYEPLQVFPIANADIREAYLSGLPLINKTVMILDGESFRVIHL